MITGLWNGISGLDSFEKALNVHSNNISNVNTIGHKSDKIVFEDLMYQSRIGKGSNVQTIEKNFNQGNIKVTNNPYDIAIKGKGFFIINDPLTNETFYSRAGNFKMNSNGTLSTVSNMNVLGLSSKKTNVVSSDLTTMFTNDYINTLASISIANNSFAQTINARTTNYNKTADKYGIHGQGYKSSGSLIADIELLIANYKEKLNLYSSSSQKKSQESSSQKTQISFANYLANLKSSSDFMEININGTKIRQNFDIDTQSTMNEFSDKISKIAGVQANIDANGLLIIDSLIPGQYLNIHSASINDDAPSIEHIVVAKNGSGIALVNNSRDALKIALEKANAKLLEITNTISLTNEKNLELNDIQLKLDNLKLSTSAFGDIEINDGFIYSKNAGNKFLLGKIQTAYFNNPLGLKAQGTNLYTANKQSGNAIHANKLNTLNSKAIELSNTKLSESLVDLMVYQRAFEASSKSITTSDEFLKIAIQLKK